MDYKLTSPCSNCPFRSDEIFHLRRARAQEIANSLLSDRGQFGCHKTVKHVCEDGDYECGPACGDTGTHCAGALIILEKMGKPHQLMRIAERVGLYDHTKLDMEAPTFDTFDEFIQAMEEV